jgi:hypothetical protein
MAFWHGQTIIRGFSRVNAFVLSGMVPDTMSHAERSMRKKVDQRKQG